MTIPAGSPSVVLSFWLHIDTAETTTLPVDRFTVKLGSTTLATFSNLDKTTGYVLHTYTIANLGGQTVTLSFTGSENLARQTSFVLDDVTLTS